MFVPRTAPGDLVEPGALRIPQTFRPRPAWPGARAVARPGRAAVSALRARRMRRLPASASRRGGAARSASRLRGRRAPSPRQARRGRPADRSRRARLRLPHQDHARRERGRTSNRAAPLRPRRRRSSTCTGATSPTPTLMDAVAGPPPPALAAAASAGDRRARAATAAERCHVLSVTGTAGLERAARARTRRSTRAGRRPPCGGRRARGVPRAMAGAGEAFPATVFEQVHPAMGDRVRAHAVAALGDVAGRHVWDLYAGIGETTAALARAGASVESVESDRRAVAEAERRGPPARRHAARVERRARRRFGAPDLVITNPPRTGMDARVAEALERRRARPHRLRLLRPGHARARPGRLPGFRLADVASFDLFPADRPRGDRRRAGPGLMKYIVTLLDRRSRSRWTATRSPSARRHLTATLRSVAGHAASGSCCSTDSRRRSPWKAEAPAAGCSPRRGERGEVEVVDERTRHIRTLTGGGDRARGPAALKAPMPGLVVRVQVETGQSVGAGTGVVVLEAMKMENELRASAPGVVAAIRVRAGRRWRRARCWWSSRDRPLDPCPLSRGYLVSLFRFDPLDHVKGNAHHENLHRHA